jgi:hypothetical protein
MQPIANPSASVNASLRGEMPRLSQRTALRFAAAGILPIAALRANESVSLKISTLQSAFSFPAMKLL